MIALAISSPFKINRSFSEKFFNFLQFYFFPSLESPQKRYTSNIFNLTN